MGQIFFCHPVNSVKALKESYVREFLWKKGEKDKGEVKCLQFQTEWTFRGHEVF